MAETPLAGITVQIPDQLALSVPAPAAPAPVVEEPAADFSNLDLGPMQDNERRGVLSDMALGVLGGARDALHSAASTVDKPARWLGEKFDSLTGMNTMGIDATLPHVADTETTAGGITKGISQFATSMIGAGKVLNALGWARKGFSLTRGFVQGGMADGLGFGANEERLSNLIQEYPMLQNPISEYLAADAADGEAEGRFKNVIEGLALGGLAETLFALARGMKSARKLNAAGDEDGALKVMAEAADEAAAVEKAAAKAEADAAALKAPEVSPEDAAKAADAAKVADEAAQAAELTGKPKAAPVVPKVLMDDAQKETFRAAVRKRFMHGEDIATTDIDFNMKALLSDADPRAAINLMSDVISDEVTKLKGGNADGVRSWRSTAALADILGEDVAGMYGKLTKTFDAVGNLDSVVVAGKTMLQSVSEHVVKLADLDDVGKLDARGKVELVQAMQFMANTQSMLKGVQTNVARAQNAQKLTRGVDLDMFKDVDFEEVLAGVGGDKAVRSLTAKLRLARDNPKAIAKLARGSLGGKLWDVHNEYWINAILSGPKTHAVNFLSNTLQTVALPTEKMLSGVFQADMATIREGAELYVGLVGAMWDSVKMAGKAFKMGQGVLDPTQLVNEAPLRAISAQNFGVSNDFGKMLIDGLGATINVPTRLLLTQDEFFKQLNYRTKLRAKAVRTGLDAGLEGDALAKHIEDSLDRGFGLTGSATNDSALQYARQATFTEDLGESLGRTIQSAVQRHPGLRPIIPFVRTPTNIIRNVWTRTPGINMLQTKYRNDILGRNGAERQADARAKMATGAALWGTAISMAQGGSITGNGPADPDVKALLKATGWQPYSVKVGDEYIAYNRLDPFGMFFGLAADYAEVVNHMDERTMVQTATAMGTALMRNLSSKTYLRGIHDAVNAASQPDRYFERWMHRQAGSYIPSIVNELNGDDTLREVRSVWDALVARTPYAAGVDPQRNLLGEKIARPVSLGPDAISPFTSSTVKGDKLLNRLAGMEHAFQPPPTKVGNVDLEQFRSPKTGYTAHDRLQELMGEVKEKGRTLRETLETVLVNDPRVAPKLTDDLKYGGEKWTGTAVSVVQGIVGGYRILALEALKKEIPGLGEAIEKDIRTGAAVKSKGAAALLK